MKKRIGQLIGSVIAGGISFFILCTVFNYIFLFTGSVKYIKSGDLPPDYYSFKLEYLYHTTQIDTKMMFLMSMVLAVLLLYKLTSSTKHDSSEIFGTSRWATTAEIKKMLYPIPEDSIEKAEKSGICLYRNNNTLYVDTQTINSLIIGTTRSGKGQTFVLPMIRILSQGKQRQSMVLNDPKGELAENSYKMLIDKGYKVVILNLRDTNLSSLWNPLSPIIKEYKNAMYKDGDVSKVSELIGELARVFTDNPKSDPIWPTSAKSLMSAIILYLLDKGYSSDCLDKLNMYSVYNFFLEYGGRTEVKDVNGAKVQVNALDQLFQKLPVGHPAKLAYATSNFATGDMRSSIFSTLSSNLEIFSDTGIAKLTSGNEIYFEDLVDPDNPCAVFMVVPDEKVNRHVLASLFINQCYSQLIDIAGKYPEQKLPQRIQFILDEFGNMVRIPSMDVKMTVCLGRNILFNLFVQDLQQLETKYDSAAATIRSNCGNLVYINSMDKETNEYMSAVLGDQTVEYDTFSGDADKSLSHQNVNVTGRKLLTAAELSNLEFGEAVTKRQRCHPIRTKFKPFYELHIPKCSITDIMDERKFDLSESMFPFDVIEQEKLLMEQEENVSTPEGQILLKIDDLYSGMFVMALNTSDFSNAKKYINEALLKKVINPDEAKTALRVINNYAEDLEK